MRRLDLYTSCLIATRLSLINNQAGGSATSVLRLFTMGTSRTVSVRMVADTKRLGSSYPLQTTPHRHRGPGQQPGWRFCYKCFALFFDGYADNKGVCPNGGGHKAEGLHFILNHHV